MRVLDLFSGIGGFSLGLERAGMHTVAFCESDAYCRAVLRRHWPDVAIFRDIRELTAADVARAIDVICGGFPCQDISFAGTGAGIEGSRSRLWTEFARITGEVQPRYIVVENVSALLGRGLGRVLGDLAALGYDAEWHCISAADIGAAHRRDRVWIVANAAGARLQEWHGLFPCGQIADTTAAAHDWRITEPAVCRAADGIPLELDFSRQITTWCDARKIDNSKAKSTRNQLVRCLLRAMWEHREIAEASPGLYVRALQNSVPEVPFTDSQSRWLLGSRIEKDKGLCDLWAEFYSEPLEKTQDLQLKLLERAWSKKRGSTLGSRVDRVRALGNAIVPQIAEIIGRAIMEGATAR